MHSFFIVHLVFATLCFTSVNFGVKTKNETKKNGRLLQSHGRRFVFPWHKGGWNSNYSIQNTNDSTDAIVIVASSEHSGDSPDWNVDGYSIVPPGRCSKLHTSCLGRCSDNKRQFQNITKKRNYPVCFCDPVCNSVFHDCCADYEKYCNASQFQEKLNKNDLDSRWQCFVQEHVPFGVWMIGSCEPKWIKNEIYKKCTRITKEMTRKASIMIPVIDENNNTFRNHYCAQCNHVKKFIPWRFTGMNCKSKLAPRADYFQQEMSFWDKYCNAEKLNFTSQTRAIRYCYDIDDDCKYNHAPEVVKNCKTMTTGLVSIHNKTYRNFDCLLCNNRPTFIPVTASCGPDNSGSRIVSYSTLFQPHSAIVPEISSRCSPGFLFDNIAGYCRELVSLNQSKSNNLLKRYSIRLRYDPDKKYTCLIDKDSFVGENGDVTRQIQRQLSVAFQSKIDNTSSKIHDWQISDLGIHVWDNTSCLVTLQVLELRRTDNETTTNFRLFYSEINDIYLISNISTSICKYSLVQDIAQEMTCTENHTYEVNESRIQDINNGTIFVNETKEHYRVGQYMMYRHKNETRLAVCKDFRPANCSYYLDVKSRTSWQMFPNRSIYSAVTASLFDYGEYSIIGDTLWLCVTKDHLNKIQTRKTSSIHDNILSYITLVSLTISLASLAVILTVYSVFPSLRNLPGKNLMLLCGVLALGQLLWLLQSEVSSVSSTLCVSMSVVLQYLFFSTFCCSNSIACHSFITFYGIAKGNLSKQTAGKAFIWYAMNSLGSPIILVAVSWLLDFYKVITIGYGSERGRHCWLGGKHGLYVAFFVPVFILLSVNSILLVATARLIHKCTKASRDLAEKKGAPSKTHVGIYLRMSTVMGLTWLFGLFQFIFPDVVVFEYLFVIVNGLQGFYIAGAFLCTYNVRKMVSKNLSKVSGMGSVSLSKLHKDRKLVR